MAGGIANIWVFALLLLSSPQQHVRCFGILSVGPCSSGIPKRATFRRTTWRTSTTLTRLSSLSPEEQTDYSTEETLLKIRFVAQANVPANEAAEALSKFSRSFPFAAVLPVQPLYYLPTPDGGVELKFLRKKTELKSGVDGGIRFFLEQLEHVPGDSDNTSSSSSCELELTVKRNSAGQTFPKIMSEKLVVLSFVGALLQHETNSQTINELAAKYSYTSTPLVDKVKISSVFHKWM